MTTPAAILEADVGDRLITRSYRVDSAGAPIVGSGFRDKQTGVEADPTTITWRMTLPDGSRIVDVFGGSTTTYPPDGGTPVVTATAIVRVALALYTREHSIAIAGSHYYGWEGDGAIEAYEEWEVYVRPRRAG